MTWLEVTAKYYYHGNNVLNLNVDVKPGVYTQILWENVGLWGDTGPAPAPAIFIQVVAQFASVSVGNYNHTMEIELQIYANGTYDAEMWFSGDVPGNHTLPSIPLPFGLSGIASYRAACETPRVNFCYLNGHPTHGEPRYK
jgi:hypothetical protein